jgi:hypothetical protein
MAVRAIARAPLCEVERRRIRVRKPGFDDPDRPEQSTSLVRKQGVILHSLIEALKKKEKDGRKAARNPRDGGSSHTNALALACLSGQLNRQSEIARPQA